MRKLSISFLCPLPSEYKIKWQVKAKLIAVVFCFVSDLSYASHAGDFQNLNQLEMILIRGDGKFKQRLEILLRVKVSLLSGNRAEFEEGIAILQDLPVNRFPLATANLLSLAVEADFSAINQEAFENVMSVVEGYFDGQEELPGRLGMTENLRWNRASYYFYLKDSESLKKLVGKQEPIGDPAEGAYLDGYIELLIARLNNSSDHAANSIYHLEGLLDVSEKQLGSVRQGRIALMLARAYFVLYESGKYEEKYVYLEQADNYVRLARANLENHLIPLFYGASLDFSADILDELINRKKGFGASDHGPNYLAALKIHRDRMRSLAAPYR